MNTKKITGLMACDPMGVIALNHKLPWSHPEEVVFFRQLIKQQIIIMGYTTYLDMPDWLLNKSYCVVFLQEPSKPLIRNRQNVVFVSSINDFLNLEALPSDKACFLIGGGKIANSFLEKNLIDDFILTEISKHYWGDTFMPLEKIKYWPKTLIGKTSHFDIHHYINPFSRKKS